MLLKETFYVSDFTYSYSAEQFKVDNNQMTSDQLVNLMDLHGKLLEVQECLSKKFNKHIDIQINSAFRSKQLNDYFVKTIGASKTSEHMEGMAADTLAIGITLNQYFESLKEFATVNPNGVLKFGQVIKEYGEHPEIETDDWVHISTPTTNHNNEFMIHNFGEGYIRVKL